jgi:hypothetical protein
MSSSTRPCASPSTSQTQLDLIWVPPLTCLARLNRELYLHHDKFCVVIHPLLKQCKSFTPVWWCKLHMLQFTWFVQTSNVRYMCFTFHVIAQTSVESYAWLSSICPSCIYGYHIYIIYWVWTFKIQEMSMNDELWNKTLTKKNEINSFYCQDILESAKPFYKIAHLYLSYIYTVSIV